MNLGLNNNTSYSGNRIKLVEGAFRIQSQQGVPGAEMRKAMNPQTKETKEIWEIPYKNLTAYIKDIAEEKNEKFGDKINVVLQADKEYTLTFNPDSTFLLNIYKRLPNVNVDLPVDFSASQAPDETGKMQTSLWMAQQGQNISYKYTNANPNGMPLTKMVKFNGKDTKDKTEQIDFLWNNAVLPFLNNLKNAKRPDVVTSGIEEDFDDINAELAGSVDPSDLPF